jgi:formate/nitrite transporter FocA (FNT family)
MNNNTLFWRGIKARFMIGLGLLFFFVALILITFRIMFLGIITFVIGLILVVYGKRNEFDYKRRSGYIVYNGN